MSVGTGAGAVRSPSWCTSPPSALGSCGMNDTNLRAVCKTYAGRLLSETEPWVINKEEVPTLKDFKHRFLRMNQPMLWKGGAREIGMKALEKWDDDYIGYSLNELGPVPVRESRYKDDVFHFNRRDGKFVRMRPLDFMKASAEEYRKAHDNRTSLYMAEVHIEGLHSLHEDIK
eukprot:Sspe_Gene.119477::Locus_115452_Transcript_1_1_Confidence_1.000_Length_518::g.119477::m.119477